MSDPLRTDVPDDYDLPMGADSAQNDFGTPKNFTGTVAQLPVMDICVFNVFIPFSHVYLVDIPGERLQTERIFAVWVLLWTIISAGKQEQKGKTGPGRASPGRINSPDF